MSGYERENVAFSAMHTLPHTFCVVQTGRHNRQLFLEFVR